jgi:cytochrome c2
MRLLKITSLFLLFTITSRLAFADVAEGEKLFTANCTSCHAISEKVVGPALKDVHKRREAAWLTKWIKNSQALVKSGDATAVALFKENNESVMTSFTNLSDAQISSIVDYIKAESEKPAATATASVGGDATAMVSSSGAQDGFYNSTTFWGLTVIAIILFLIVFILFSIRKVVDQLYAQKFPEAAAEEAEASLSWKERPESFRYKLFKKHPVVGVMVISMVFMAAAGLYGFDYGNKEVGVQKGYAPTQPRIACR